MVAPYGETQCPNKVELHTGLEVPPHGQGQCFTQHERHPHTEFDVQAPHEETHCALRNTEAQIPTALGKKYAKRQSGETRTSLGRFVSMLIWERFERTAFHSTIALQEKITIAGHDGAQQP